jgi:flagellar motility protein MotE (MotC chaperone)
METIQVLPHVSDELAEMLRVFRERRDSEVSELAYVLPQYVTDPDDKQAYRDIDRQVNALARAFDRMIAKLEKWQAEAEKIEASVTCFYGE